jgi:hypothetical protein
MIRKGIYTVLVFASFMVFTSLYAQSPLHVQTLRGMWKFRIGDDPQWALVRFDDSSWGEIYAPSNWESHGYAGYDGFAWYRKRFVISEDFNSHKLVLELGYIDDVDEVFINGEKIGQTGSFPNNYSTAYNSRRRYSIPNQLLRFGSSNLIAVRVYDSQLEGGITGGDLKIESLGVTVVPDIDMTGKWLISKGRSFEKSLSREITVPGAWENQGMMNYDGFAVYQQTFKASASLTNQILVMMAGRIDDLDEVFINGVKVGATGSFAFRDTEDYYREFRNYVIPQGVVKPGDNTIEIKIYDGHGEGGIIEGPVGIISQTRFREYWKQKRRQ